MCLLAYTSILIGSSSRLSALGSVSVSGTFVIGSIMNGSRMITGKNGTFLLRVFNIVQSNTKMAQGLLTLTPLRVVGGNDSE